MSIETAVLIDTSGNVIHWHAPPDATATHIPDSADLWSVIWANRDRLGTIAHSHPGSGAPWASTTDLTTFAAIEAALGKRLQWWIITQDQLAIWHYCGPDGVLDHDYYIESRYDYDDPGMLPACLTELYNRSYTNHA